MAFPTRTLSPAQKRRQIEDEGYDAARAGKGYDDNPYPAGSWRADCWDAGLVDGMYEDHLDAVACC